MLSSWNRIEEIFHATLAVLPRRRKAVLKNLCAGDEELQSEVASLLQADHLHEEGRPVSLLERHPGELAAELLALERPLLGDGQRIGSYRVVSLLAMGGMGEVYLAEDETRGCRAALKFLPRRFSSNAPRMRRLELEARATAAMSHPNVVTVFELGQSDFGHFIAMEYVEGLTLGAVIARRPSVAEAVSLIAQTASALAAAHEAGIVHRDIKPDNIMVRPDGQVKVLDFGLAVERGEASGDESALGTVCYMSPQQATGQPPTMSCDIFSLGIIAHELLMGSHPFKGSTSEEVMRSIQSGSRTSVRAVNPAVPAGLRQVIERMLAKNPARRPTAAEVALTVGSALQ